MREHEFEISILTGRYISTGCSYIDTVTSPVYILDNSEGIGIIV
jgi:hypothetical protein